MLNLVLVITSKRVVTVLRRLANPPFVGFWNGSAWPLICRLRNYTDNNERVRTHLRVTLKNCKFSLFYNMGTVPINRISREKKYDLSKGLDNCPPIIKLCAWWFIVTITNSTNFFHIQLDQLLIETCASYYFHCLFTIYRLKMDINSTSLRFFIFPVSMATSTSCIFCKRKGCFGMVLHLFDFSVYSISIYQVVILLFLADVFNCQVSSALLCIDVIRNGATSMLPKISLIQSWSHEPCYILRAWATKLR